MTMFSYIYFVTMFSCCFICIYNISVVFIWQNKKAFFSSGQICQIMVSCTYRYLVFGRLEAWIVVHVERNAVRQTVVQQ